MEKYLFNFFMYCLPFLSFQEAKASEKVDFSDFFTEKDQNQKKSFPSYSTYGYHYEGVDIDEELAVFRKINNKMFYHRLMSLMPRILKFLKK